MDYGICNLTIVPLRLEPSDASEMVTQVLLGEHCKVLEIRKKWSKVRLAYDGYEGWLDNKQFDLIDETEYKLIENTPLHISENIIDFATNDSSIPTNILLGSHLPHFNKNSFKIANTQYTGQEIAYTKGKQPKENLIATALQFINTPYLWGGKSSFGIDCSGLSQLVYKVNGYALLRDASQQAAQGEVLSFIEESEPGDLAFFDNEEGNIIHVGIIMEDNYIIHAHGKVRIDRLDHIGIYNVDTKKHSHKLRVIKKII